MLHIVTGCMFAGKTTELANIYNYLITTVNPPKIIVVDYDTGNQSTILYTHDGTSVHCTSIIHLSIEQLNYDVILINEAQFFKGLKEFVVRALEIGKIVYLFGLDGDFKQEKFGELIDLLPMADTYKKLYATCACGAKASFSKRLSNEISQYGPHDKYVPVCRACLS
jgi:thymidine kinase